jgi:hypothetical protein
MMFTTIRELNETLMRHPIFKYARLRLNNYLVVVAENGQTNDWLASLEYNGYLPLTVACSQEARKVRMYRRKKGIQTGGVLFSGLSMTILTGADNMCLVASPLNRLRDYDDLGDESLLKEEPAALKGQALRVLKSLIFITDSLSSHYWT